MTGGAVVIGIGLNVAQRADELPPPSDPRAYPPTSLALVASACTDRDPLVRAVLRDLADWYARFTAANGDPDASGLRAAYLERCHTVGREVAVVLPGGETVWGKATGVDVEGRLSVETAAGARLLAAGDVLRVR
jgi:BirA family transcriptional regulator, biotin operon repressor / biotin---[acetyl-CoA-carboxylase] ligase